ncbi:Molybdenum cofactor biosynthesis protein 1 [Sphaceloma murrayae]|uniref:Molybdenum cofactor biosynthesis protein 1 n=1 Tax=Sphaceloma murrayae TaxID=2082308 RepID=A0A2K1QQV1_9PEZI|nr:Molybdenum cofactor biosynthesis protein 1 [Sphaceloma murrayae]
MAVSRLTRQGLRVLRSQRTSIRVRYGSSAAAAATTTRHDVPTPYPLPSQTPPDSELSPRRAALRSSAPFSSFLTDTFGRQHDYLRISLTERCNLRCTYCMPSEGVPLSPASDLLTTAEIVYLSSLFISQGVRKIRLTGGEPTVRKDFMELLGRIGEWKGRGLDELAITTNGLLLERRIEAMVERGLTGVNISLDTLEPAMFQIMTRRKGWENVMRGIEKVLDLKRKGREVKLKVNCVVMRGVNDREVLDFVEFTRERDLEVRFIEYMPFDGNKWSRGKMVSYGEMVEMIKTRYPEFRRVGEGKNETSKTWEVPNFMGRLGFITSMTHNFCGTCNRLRITSDGNLKVCLFGNSEVSLRDMIRKDHEGEPMNEEAFEAIRELEMNRRQSLGGSTEPSFWTQREAELLDIIGLAVRRKKEKHAGMGQLENMKNRPMILIDEPILRQPPNLLKPAVPLAIFSRPSRLRSRVVPLHLLGPSHPSLSAASMRFISNRYSRPPHVLDKANSEAERGSSRTMEPDARDERALPSNEVSPEIVSNGDAVDSAASDMDQASGPSIRKFPAKRSFWGKPPISLVPDSDAVDSAASDANQASGLSIRKFAAKRTFRIGARIPTVQDTNTSRAKLDRSPKSKRRQISSRSARTKRSFPAFTDSPSDKAATVPKRDWTSRSTVTADTSTPTAGPSFPFTDPPTLTTDASTLTPGPTTLTAKQSTLKAEGASTDKLTHISPTGAVSMVDITSKRPTKRTAIAFGCVTFSVEYLHKYISSNSISKGNVLTTAQIAGIQAAKRTSDLIPLCHPLPLHNVYVDVAVHSRVAEEDIEARRWKGYASRTMQKNWRAEIVAMVSTRGSTGVEMEALAAVMGAGLTVVDMCKAVDKGMRIEDVEVVYKAGGRSGVFKRVEKRYGILLEDLAKKGLIDGKDVEKMSPKSWMDL